jgi:mono/diheme cytochrome c family protein
LILYLIGSECGTPVHPACRFFVETPRIPPGVFVKAPTRPPMQRPSVIFAAIVSTAAAQEKTTYDEHVLPVFQQSCLNCHNPDKTKGGLDLSSFPATMKGGSGGKIVEPGDPGSTLISVVRHTAEPKMPPEGERLAEDQIRILTKWIEGGLLENATSAARKPSKPKFETSPRTDPATKPDGPPPMPVHLRLEPTVTTQKASAVRSLALSPWAPLLAATGQRQILLHHAETLDLIGILPFPEGDPVSLAFTPDARHLIVGGGIPGKSGVTVTFDVTNGSRLLQAGKEFDSILAADIRPGFDLVATGGPSRILKLWNTTSGEPVKSIKKHTDWITALDISPDGVLLASGDRNGGVWVWESETANEFHTLRAHQAAITTTVFRGDSNLLATASADGTLRFWEMNGGSEIKKIDAHPGGVTAFTFGRDGSSLSAGRDSKAKLWKPDFNHARDIAQNLPALPTAVALDSENKRAFIGDARGIILVFNIADGKPLGEIQTNPPPVATRIADLNSRIVDQETLIATAQAHLAAMTTARDTARLAFDAAEKSHRQAVEIHQAAQAGANQNPGESSAHLAAEAASRITPAAEVLQNRRNALAAAEKSLAEATKALDDAKSPLARLSRERKHWAAANLNTRSLEARALAEASSLATENSQIAFTEAARAIARQAETLNLKRLQREHLALPTPAMPSSPETLAERDATLAAIDIIACRELETLRRLEADLIKIYHAIDPDAALAEAKKLEAESLMRAYLKLLE